MRVAVAVAVRDDDDVRVEVRDDDDVAADVHEDVAVGVLVGDRVSVPEDVEAACRRGAAAGSSAGAPCSAA